LSAAYSFHSGAGKIKLIEKIWLASANLEAPFLSLLHFVPLDVTCQVKRSPSSYPMVSGNAELQHLRGGKTSHAKPEGVRKKTWFSEKELRSLELRPQLGCLPHKSLTSSGLELFSCKMEVRGGGGSEEADSMNFKHSTLQPSSASPATKSGSSKVDTSENGNISH
jgi:hypothetical protein